MTVSIRQLRDEDAARDWALGTRANWATPSDTAAFAQLGLANAFENNAFGAWFVGPVQPSSEVATPRNVAAVFWHRELAVHVDATINSDGKVAALKNWADVQYGKLPA